ncbi:MAG TPA: hypothetical protein VFT22_29770 [Kofleriaceae bacterium]|nr:hypothetical protein [Kofleriaceae bacterium]
MRTLALLLFIAGTAAIAVFLARRPTVADGRVMEADLLGQLRKNGVVGMACDREIPIGRQGAVFTCVATLDSGATQTVEYTMDRAGGLSASLKSATDATRDRIPARIPAREDPWDN